jgi:hypothetical protein
MVLWWKNDLQCESISIPLLESLINLRQNIWQRNQKALKDGKDSLSLSGLARKIRFARAKGDGGSPGIDREGFGGILPGGGKVWPEDGD